MLKPVGILIVLSDRMPRSEELLKSVSVEGSVKVVTEYHSENAPGSIRVTPSGITTFEMDRYSW